MPILVRHVTRYVLRVSPYKSKTWVASLNKEAFYQGVIPTFKILIQLEFLVISGTNRDQKCLFVAIKQHLVLRYIYSKFIKNFVLKLSLLIKLLIDIYYPVWDVFL